MPVFSEAGGRSGLGMELKLINLASKQKFPALVWIVLTCGFDDFSKHITLAEGMCGIMLLVFCYARSVVRSIFYTREGFMQVCFFHQLVSGGDEIPAKLFQILKDDAVKVLHSICQQIWKT